MLQTDGARIIESNGEEVRLMGVGVPWMNMENFIQGYPGTMQDLQSQTARQLGQDRADVIFENWAESYFRKEDVQYVRTLGLNAVRLALNYRSFEDDTNPRVVKSEGIDRLDAALDWCRESGVYAILDMHAVPGGQNPDWHSDNSTHRAEFWRYRDFQDRYFWLWQQLAGRYAGDEIVAGYDVLNEPSTQGPYGKPDWQSLNGLHSKIVDVIRQVDKDHIIFLEGDNCSSTFEGMQAPFAHNLVYSPHDYSVACTRPGPFPGVIAGKYRDEADMKQTFLAMDAMKYARKHNVPVLVGEFGAPYNLPPAEAVHRMRALDSHIDAFEDAGVSWALWNIKDVGVMGLSRLKTNSPYLELTADFQQAKRLLGGDQWIEWGDPSELQLGYEALASIIAKLAAPRDDAVTEAGLKHLMRQSAIDMAARMLLPHYVDLFKDKGETEIKNIFDSFKIEHCEPSPLQAVVASHTARFTV